MHPFPLKEWRRHLNRQDSHADLYSRRLCTNIQPSRHMPLYKRGHMSFIQRQCNVMTFRRRCTSVMCPLGSTRGVNTLSSGYADLNSNRCCKRLLTELGYNFECHSVHCCYTLLFLKVYMEEAANVLCACVGTAFLSWITCAYQAPPYPPYTQPGHVEYELDILSV